MGFKDITAPISDFLSASRVYGTPFEKDGLTVIPAATVMGGGGGGHETAEKDGLGFGMFARPNGAFVIRGSEVSWVPAIDVTMWGLMALGVAGLMVWSLSRARRRKR